MLVGMLVGADAAASGRFTVCSVGALVAGTGPAAHAARSAPLTTARIMSIKGAHLLKSWVFMLGNNKLLADM
jgi:hypothetical protein